VNSDRNEKGGGEGKKLQADCAAGGSGDEVNQDDWTSEKEGLPVLRSCKYPYTAVQQSEI
jgi:hypothetical protein